jgi:hypothetical protein
MAYFNRISLSAAGHYKLVTLHTSSQFIFYIIILEDYPVPRKWILPSHFCTQLFQLYFVDGMKWKQKIPHCWNNIFGIKSSLKIDHPEKLATLGTQDEEKQNTICVGHHYAQTSTNKRNNTWTCYKQVYN